VTTINNSNSLLLNLFANSSTSTTSTASNNIIALLPQALAPSTVSTTISANATRYPTPPWNSGSTAPQQADLTTSALAGHPFINENAISLDVTGNDDEDYRKLFALYQGLNALDGIIAKAQAKGLTTLQTSQYEKAFSSGVAQITSWVNQTSLNHVQIAAGQTATKETTSAGVPLESQQYIGQSFYIGDPTQPVPAFLGQVQFSMQVKSILGTNVTVNFDLNDMGATPRTLANVLQYLNGQLAAAGVTTRFADKQTAASSSTITAGGKTITLPDPPQKYSLVLNTSSLETITLGAPATADAVYVTQSATQVVTSTAKTPVMGTSTTTSANVTTTTTGSNTTTTTVTQQLLKFQTDQSSTASPPPDATVRPGDANSVAGRAWSQSLQTSVSSAISSATGSDGSVYVLANVDGAVAGQQIAGASDVALMKYDSAGNLIFTRTLGAQVNASGMSLAVGADGSIAVAGSVTGALDNGDAGDDPASPDSFVSVYNTDGEEQWTQRLGAIGADQANAVAFGADGSVYVAGKSQSPMPGSGASYGGWDGYVMGFDAQGAHEFTKQFGTSGSDTATALTVNGDSVIVGGIDNGDAVVRAFDVSTPSAVTMTASQDLGALQGGSIVGVAMNNGQLVVAGTARNPALGSGVATAVDAAPGGSNVFVASLDPTLSSTAGNTIAWYGGSGDDTATAMAVANGQIYVAGKTSSDLPGTTAIGTQDGFLAQIDPTSGAATWSERFSGPGGSVAPTSIAVASGGASVLDRLGLPTGLVQNGDPSNLITAATSLRAGDKFTIAANSGGPRTVTIDANDTLQTLATKIQRASGFNASVSVIVSGGVEQLVIKPANSRAVITLGQGPKGQDALTQLGLKTGVIEQTPDPNDSSAKPLSGLNLSTALNLNDTASIATAKAVIEQAMSTVKVAYQNTVSAGQPKPKPAKNASGPVPAYLTAQIANYQAALRRLTGQA
jgi:hypothetical protein